MRNPKRKDKERVERARVHSAVSIAALAAGLASVTSSESCSKESGSMMTLALASATELLASHCIEMAEQAGADRECVLAATVRSSIDIHKPLLFSLHTKFQSCASCEHTHWYTLGFGYCMDVVNLYFSMRVSWFTQAAYLFLNLWFQEIKSSRGKERTRLRQPQFQ